MGNKKISYTINTVIFFKKQKNKTLYKMMCYWQRAPVGDK